jgi:hypothetical protein
MTLGRRERDRKYLGKRFLSRHGDTIPEHSGVVNRWRTLRHRTGCAHVNRMRGRARALCATWRGDGVAAEGRCSARRAGARHSRDTGMCGRGSRAAVGADAGHRGMTDRGVRITRHELVAFAKVRASSGGQPTLSVRPGQRNALLWVRVPKLRKARGESKPK